MPDVDKLPERADVLPEGLPPRAPIVRRKVATPFGSMYVDVAYAWAADGSPRLVGGALSDPQKEPDAQVAQLVAALSEGLDDCLAEIGRRGVCDAAQRTGIGDQGPEQDDGKYSHGRDK